VEVRIVGHATERTLARVRRTGAVVALTATLTLLIGGCTDDKPPAGLRGDTSTEVNSFAPPASASPADAEQARSLARTFAEGLQQSAPTRITPRQVDCLVDQVVAHLNVNVLSDIAGRQPDPSTLPPIVREAFVNAFDRCLPPDVAASLRDRFTPS
jgi:hypothetical protein